jgi:hypothetical protein
MYRFVFFLLLIATVAAAQPRGPMLEHPEMRERVRTLMVWRLTEVLSLETETSSRFFPVFNAYLDEREKIGNMRQGTLERLRIATETGDEESIRTTLSDLRELERRQLQARVDYLDRTARTLTVVQQARLVLFEENFQRELRELIQSIREQTRPPGVERRRP